MNIILMGAQGSGKGTQAEFLTTTLGVRHLASGDIFRSAAHSQTPLGVEAKRYMDRGDLVPDEITIGLILDILGRPEYEPGVVLDGFPRTRDQAKALDAVLPQLRRQIDRVVYLNVPRALLETRLAGRYVCTAEAQHVYNIISNPPRVAGICDIDGTSLVQRDDDKPEAIAKRLRIFFEQTIHVVHYYRAQGKLAEIDGSLSIPEVQDEIVAQLRLSAPTP
jgi:adenylate kinase